MTYGLQINTAFGLDDGTTFRSARRVGKTYHDLTPNSGNTTSVSAPSGSGWNGTTNGFVYCSFVGGCNAYDYSPSFSLTSTGVDFFWFFNNNSMCGKVYIHWFRYK